MIQRSKWQTGDNNWMKSDFHLTEESRRRMSFTSSAALSLLILLLRTISIWVDDLKCVKDVVSGFGGNAAVTGNEFDRRVSFYLPISFSLIRI